MIYSDFNGLKISKLGFGAMRFPEEQEKIDEMIKKAHESGVNYFDTAYIYRNSEERLGKALKLLDRSTYYVADKLPPFLLKCKEDADVLFEKSLKRLGLEYIDFYLIHCIDEDNLKFTKKFDLINWAIEKKREGKIKYIGFSIHDTAEVLKETLELFDWDFVQIQYNYMDIIHEPGEEGYNILREKNIPIIIMEPLKGGILSNISEEVAKPFKGKSAASYAFRWILEKEGILTVLSGMSDVKQVKENCETFAARSSLAPAELEAIAEVKENIVKLQRVACTACGYCLPCPVEINIPAMFNTWNTIAMNNTGQWISGTEIDREKAKECIVCNKCVERCPQKLEIPKNIKEIADGK